MAFVLTKRYEDLVARLVESGRYNNQSEVVRAGLRLLEEKELGYLPRPAFRPEELEKFYTRQSKADRAAERQAVAAGLKPHQAE
jgi:Arc/MetJ-type ribon-helix-helix transcriptional regulator